MLLAAGAFVLLALLIFGGRLFGGGPAGPGEDAEGRLSFLADCGWEVEPGSEQAQEIRIPEVFTPVYEDYNELQKQQGYDLSRYAGEDVTLYTYTVTNWPDESQTVVADLYVFRGEIVGGDVHSTNLDGFMVGLK